MKFKVEKRKGKSKATLRIDPVVLHLIIVYLLKLIDSLIP